MAHTYVLATLVHYFDNHKSYVRLVEEFPLFSKKKKNLHSLASDASLLNTLEASNGSQTAMTISEVSVPRFSNYL